MRKNLLSVLILLSIIGNLFAQGKDPVLKEAVKALAKELSEAYKEISDLDKTISENVTMIIKRGYQMFSQSSTVRQLTGVSNTMAKPLFENIADSINLPEKYMDDFQHSLYKVIHHTENEWVLTRILYSINNGSACKYVCVLGRNVKDMQKSDWIITEVQSKFVLAPNIMIVKETETSDGGLNNQTIIKFVNVPKEVKHDDIIVILAFFEIVTIKRLEQLEGNHLSNIPTIQNSILPKKQFFLAAAIMVAEAIQAAAKAWKFLAKTFGTKVKDSLKQIIVSQGFSYFNSGAQINKADAIEGASFDKYIDMLLKTLKVPTDKAAKLKSALDLAKFSDNTTWNSFDIAYNKTDGGICKYINLMIYRNTTANTYDMLIADIDTDFKLAPELLVIQHSRSVLGGAYASDKVIFQEVPASLTLNDIKLLFKFFEIIAFKNIGVLLGLDLNYPEIPKAEINSLRKVLK